MNTVVANLRSRVVQKLDDKGPLKFGRLASTLRIKDIKRLDNVLQSLRTTKQIFYTGHTHGWKIGRGPVFGPNVR